MEEREEIQIKKGVRERRKGEMITCMRGEKGIKE